MKCVAYVRTASKNNEVALTKQMEMIKEFISEKNWKLDSVYTDVESGVKVNENLHKMIEDAQKGKIDVIVAADTTRILRTKEMANVLGKLYELNKVHLITVDNRINTFLNDDITVLNVYAYLNECEAKVMSQRIKDGKRFKKQKS
ncbi:recombinase family protein [Virgibacillus sp. SK37]|uniref:recombinase family protein n=1 Tax=Virgibacillus sp. SK37 TaxID=403957 RepID=UPI0011A93D8B|nr:recombinase family protein [Virgibacillus sp. SK37]